MNYTDQPTSVRKGEELDKKRVAAFLSDAIPGLSGDLSIRQFPGGYSNLTYMLNMGNREFVLRRPPFGTKAKSAHDMSREYRILRALRPVFPYCPEPLAFTDDPSIMGCPFYIMERLQGIILRRDLPPGMTLTPNRCPTTLRKSDRSPGRAACHRLRRNRSGQLRQSARVRKTPG